MSYKSGIGRVYIRAYRNDWDRQKKRSFPEARMQVGPLQPDGMVRLSAEFREHFPAYAEGDWFWADHELVSEEQFREEFPTTPQPKDISWSDETIRVGLTFAAWTTAQRMGILEDFIRCHTTFRHPFNLSWSGKTCDIRRSSKTTS